MVQKKTTKTSSAKKTKITPKDDSGLLFNEPEVSGKKNKKSSLGYEEKGYKKANLTTNEPIAEYNVRHIQTEKEIELSEINKRNNENIIRKFDKSLPIYLQIHIGNIYSIFGSGIILPSQYVKNRTFHDPQSIEQGYLVLSNGAFHREESVALLEINLLNNEYSELKISGGVAYFEKPISISRIKRIYVLNERIKKEIISTALTNDGGIIPDALVTSPLPNSIFYFDFEKVDFKRSNIDYTSKIVQYNKILGVLAFLKNYSILLAEKSNTAATYPEHFFYALQSLNNAQMLQVASNERAVTFYSQLFGLQNGIDNPALKWIFDRLSMNKNFNDEDISEFSNVFLNTLTSKESLTLVKHILNNLRNSLERKKVIKDILQLSGSDKFALYLFAFLRVYGNANTEEKSISRLDIPEYVSMSYGEFVFAILGYFYGYSTLRNFDEKLNMRDDIFKEVLSVSRRLPIKFELNTMLDYVVLESVYYNVFIQSDRNINTNFLESDSIKQDWVKKNVKIPDNYTYKVEEVFGKQVYQINRRPTLNDLDLLLDRLPIDIPVISDLGIFCFQNKIPYHFINLGDLFRESRLRYFLYFKKEDIKEAINNKKINVQELKKRIEADISAKQL